MKIILNFNESTTYMRNMRRYEQETSIADHTITYELGE